MIVLNDQNQRYLIVDFWITRLNWTIKIINFYFEFDSIYIKTYFLKNFRKFAIHFFRCIVFCFLFISLIVFIMWWIFFWLFLFICCIVSFYFWISISTIKFYFFVSYLFINRFFNVKNVVFQKLYLFVSLFYFIFKKQYRQQ